MQLCLYTDSVGQLDTATAFRFAAELGVPTVEVSVGGQSAAPHADVESLLRDRHALEDYRGLLRAHDLRLAAVNCSAWPLHPQHGARHDLLIKNAIRLAHDLGVDKIVTMSGTPGDAATSSVVNWITFPWPAQNPDDSTADDLARVLDRQWQQVGDYWTEVASFALRHGVTKVALELHPVHLVYNVPTLLRLRAAVGPTLGANVDPSHMFWQQMDPVAVVRALGSAVQHVHLKDVKYQASRLALSGVLDLVPFEEPHERAWNFTTVGEGHDATFWSAFVGALEQIGYDDVLSIENEDPARPQRDGVTRAVRFMRELLPG